MERTVWRMIAGILLLVVLIAGVPAVVVLLFWKLDFGVRSASCWILAVAAIVGFFYDLAHEDGMLRKFVRWLVELIERLE